MLFVFGVYNPPAFLNTLKRIRVPKKDLFFDVKRGICTIILTNGNLRSLNGFDAVPRRSGQLLHPDAYSTAEDSLENIEAQFIGLEETPSVPRTSEEEIVEQLYYLRTKLCSLFFVLT